MSFDYFSTSGAIYFQRKIFSYTATLPKQKRKYHLHLLYMIGWVFWAYRYWILMAADWSNNVIDIFFDLGKLSPKAYICMDKFALNNFCEMFTRSEKVIAWELRQHVWHPVVFYMIFKLSEHISVNLLCRHLIWRNCHPSPRDENKLLWLYFSQKTTFFGHYHD